MNGDVRLPLAPFEQILAGRLGRPPTVDELAAELGCSDQSVYRRRKAGVTVWEADRIAVRWQMHPVDVYGFDVWLSTITDEVAA